MPRGVKLSPEERAARIAEYEKKRLEKKAIREANKKFRAEETARKAAKKSAAAEAALVVAIGSSPQLIALSQILGKSRRIISVPEPTREALAEIFAASCDFVIVDDWRHCLLLDDDTVITGCVIDCSEQNWHLEAEKSLKNVWLSSFWRYDTKNAILGGIRCYSSRVAIALNEAGEKSTLHRPSLASSVAVREISLGREPKYERALDRYESEALHEHLGGK